MHLGDRKQLQGDRANGPRVIDLGYRLHEGHGIIDRKCDVRVQSPLDVVAFLMVARDEEARKRELAEWSCGRHCLSDRCSVEVLEYRASAGVRIEMGSFLTGILDREEHRLSSGTSDLVESG